MEIELAEAVGVLRDELLAAVAQGVNQDVVFEVGPIELEFLVELRQDVKVKSGFKAWVVSGDAEGGLARGRTHRVKLALTPQRPGGGGLLISREPYDPQAGEGPGRIGR